MLPALELDMAFPFCSPEGAMAFQLVGSADHESEIHVIDAEKWRHKVL